MNAKTKTEEAKRPQDDAANALAVKPANAVATVDFGDDAGGGLENVGANELSIPFLRILQSNSPQVAPDTGVPGAKVGMILNTGTNELIDGKAGVQMIFVARDHNFPEWTPRDAGGGFVSIHSEDDPLVADLQKKHGQFGKLPTPSGTELVEAYYLYGYILSEEGYIVGPAVVSFSSTQIKKYRNFITRTDNMRYPNSAGAMDKPPLWSHRWLMTTTGEKNKKGSFFGWRIESAARRADGGEGDPKATVMTKDDPRFLQSKAFRDSVKAGKAKADFKTAEREPGADEEIPM